MASLCYLILPVENTFIVLNDVKSLSMALFVIMAVAPFLKSIQMLVRGTFGQQISNMYLEKTLFWREYSCTASKSLSSTTNSNTETFMLCLVAI